MPDESSPTGSTPTRTEAAAKASGLGKQAAKLGFRESPAKDPRRERRMVALVDAFVYFEDSCDRYKESLSPEELEVWAKEDGKWFERTFHGQASLIMESGILMNLFAMATAKNAQTLPASKVILPAVNKRRYNLGVQKQETANEGVADLLSKVSQTPMSHIDVVNILVQSGNMPKGMEVIDSGGVRKIPEVVIPTLDEAIQAAGPQRLIENKTIKEDADLLIALGDSEDG